MWPTEGESSFKNTPRFAATNGIHHKHTDWIVSVCEEACEYGGLQWHIPKSRDVDLAPSMALHCCILDLNTCDGTEAIEFIFPSEAQRTGCLRDNCHIWRLVRGNCEMDG